MDFLKSSINLPALSTGTSLMKMSGGLGNGATQMSSMESMKEVFLEIRDNTKETVELLKTMVLGDSTQDKKDAITAGDIDGSKPKGPGILSKVGSTLSKLNPFGGGGLMDTLGKLGLALGGIALITFFGDKAVPFLADLIKSIKEGKMTGKIKEISDYLMNKGEKAFESLRKGLILVVESIEKIYNIIKSAYEAVETYVNSFDTDKEEGLSKTEMDALKKDVSKKVGTFVKDVIVGAFGTLFSGLGLATGIAAAASVISLPMLKKSLGLGAGAGGKAAGAVKTAGAARLGVFGSLAIGLIVANSIFKTYQQMAMAIERAGEDGEFNGAGFVGAFFGGDKEGTWGNAFKQASTFGQIFAGTGAVIGLSAAGPGGALLGGALGYLLGALVGGIGGYLGADRIKEMATHFTDMLDDTETTVSNYFTDLIKGIKNVFDGDPSTTFSGPSTDRDLGDTKGKKEELVDIDKQITDVNTQMSLDENYAKSDEAKNNLMILNQQKQEKIEEIELSKSFNKTNTLEYIDDDIKKKEKRLDKITKKIKKGDLFPGLSIGSFGITTYKQAQHQKTIDPTYETHAEEAARLKKELGILENQKIKANQNISSDDLVITSNERAKENIAKSEFVLDQYMAKRLSELGMSLIPSPFGGTGNMIVAPTVDKSIKTSNQTINHGGLSFLHQNKTAENVKYSQVRE